MKKLSLIILLIIFSCKENNHKEIESFIQDIKTSMSQEDLEKFKNASMDPFENDFIFIYRYKDVFLASKEGEPVKKYFEKIGINHNNYIANILFTGLKRDLNNEKLNLEELIRSTIEAQARFFEGHPDNVPN